MRIAFLGLGRMGLHMARNLLDTPHTLTVYNRTPGRAKSLVSLGAREAGSVAAALEDAEVAITMLSNDEAVKEVVLGPGGLLHHLPAKAIHLCMSTIEVETSAEMASAHTKAGQGYVAAPVFGRADSAKTKRIWFVAGGLEPQVNRCRPIFEALGQGYTRVGPHAAPAHALKLSGNMLSMAMELAVSEILVYAKKAGLPPADFLRFLNTAVFRSHMVDTYGEHTERPSFDPDDRTLDLAANELLLQKARDMGAQIPLEDLLQVRLQAATARGWGVQDLADLTQAFRSETGSGNAPAPGPKVQEPSPTPPPAPKVQQPPSSPPPALERQAPSAPPPAAPQVPPPAPPPAPKGQAAIPPVRREPQQRLPESKKPSNAKRNGPSKERHQRLPQPILEGATTPPAKSNETKGSSFPQDSMPKPSSSGFSALDMGNPVTLDLNQTSHFELIDGQVWAWSQGRSFQTPWKSFAEVEQAFNQVLFLLIKRHLLLRPQAVLDLRPTFGGGARARVSDDQELPVGRAVASRLRDLLGF